MYESFILLGIASIFAFIYVMITISKMEMSLFDIVLKDVCVLLTFIFIFFALTTNQVLTNQQTITLTYTMINTTINTTSNTIYLYSHDPTLDSLANGFGYVFYPIGALFLANMIWEIWDYAFNKKGKK